MTKYTKEWWTYRSEECAEEEFIKATQRIGNILELTGQWNTGARVLEVQCGLGVMSQFMYDKGFEKFYGIDNDRNVSEFWENKDVLQTAEPDDIPFDDRYFHFVTWFSMNDGRVDQKRYERVLDEMYRVSRGHIMVKPFDEWSKEKDEEFLGWMFDNRWECEKVTPVLWFYHFKKIGDK